MPKFESRAVVRKAIECHREELLAKKNVVGFGVGKKNMKSHKDNALVVFVRKKVRTPDAEKELSKEDIIPSEVDGIITDVVEVGDITIESTTGRHRPAVGGISAGHYRVTAGTLGAVCYDIHTDETLILSNNHVFANNNNANIGDIIYQPGKFDIVGTPSNNDVIATLHRFVPIDFGDDDLSDCFISNIIARVLNWVLRKTGHATQYRTTKKKLKTIEDTENLVDAAIGIPLEEDLVENTILNLGTIEGISSVAIDDTIFKSGRTTGVTTGTVMYLDAEVAVGFGPGKIVYFVDQILTTNMSAGGDSGSVICRVIDGKLYAIGLLFAGSDQVTVANKIQHVVDALDIKFIK